MTRELTVSELIDLLQDEDPDAPIRIVHQRSWPLQEVVGGVASSFDIAGEEAAEQGEAVDPDIVDPVVYLVADGHPDEPYYGHANESPYGPRRAWDVMRRGR